MTGEGHPLKQAYSNVESILDKLLENYQTRSEDDYLRCISGAKGYLKTKLRYLDKIRTIIIKAIEDSVSPEMPGKFYEYTLLEIDGQIDRIVNAIQTLAYERIELQRLFDLRDKHDRNIRESQENSG